MEGGGAFVRVEEDVVVVEYGTEGGFGHGVVVAEPYAETNLDFGREGANSGVLWQVLYYDGYGYLFFGAHFDWDCYVDGCAIDVYAFGFLYVDREVFSLVEGLGDWLKIEIRDGVDRLFCAEQRDEFGRYGYGVIHDVLRCEFDYVACNHRHRFGVEAYVFRRVVARIKLYDFGGRRELRKNFLELLFVFDFEGGRFVEVVG